MRLCVIGSGYVGLVTAAVFADLGNDVACVDVDEKKIESLNNRVMPIYEPGLEEMVTRNMDEGRVSFSTDVDSGVKGADVVFICVGTPPKDDGETDLSYIESAARTIGERLNGYKIVVNKSTVPVGTGDLVRRVINETKTTDANFDVVSNPEFLREGSAIGDALNPDRVVIGAPTKEVAVKLLELYATLGSPMLITDVESAEIIKYASNSFLATKISFINAIADICEKVGANVNDVAKGMGADRRIGKEFLNAGLGFGGSCFPKDVLSLIHTSGKLGAEFSLLKEVVKINEERVNHFVHRVIDRFPDVASCTFGVLGLAFKPDTDDMREAKSIDIIKQLTAHGAKVRAYDPVSMDNAAKEMPDITYCDSAYDALTGVDAMIVVTEWREFKLLDMERIKGLMKTPVIFDGRNVYDAGRVRSAGFEYFSIGRG
ncbi:UDP-glucose 6-dehydrogenase [hydrothermal vent metagenome]|uniref:UDP-glucose 6-dehydrogenase n=1 Tax=hydrothermal vent metagenome TaxID=652676 RepID=A0A3B1BUK8_9ZZZZ